MSTKSLGIQDVKPGSLDWLASKVDNTFLQDLEADPEQESHAPNKRRREVKSGHYVLVKPTPLPEPSLVSYSKIMARSLGISDEECTSERFARFFSGDIDVIPGFVSWATPYALSIYGQVSSAHTHSARFENPTTRPTLPQEMYQQCPFQNGNGYGDGRAVSYGEVRSLSLSTHALTHTHTRTTAEIHHRGCSCRQSATFTSYAPSYRAPHEYRLIESPRRRRRRFLGGGRYRWTTGRGGSSTSRGPGRRPSAAAATAAPCCAPASASSSCRRPCTA
jgi:hypothetical protein